jgi:hypothetical protein
MFNTRSARVELFGLLGQRLTLRIEFCLEPPDLFVVGHNQRCLLLNKIEQRLDLPPFSAR